MALPVVAASNDVGTIDVTDLTPKFLKFYREAVADKLAPDARFALWKKEYGFAAVPPTPEGDQIARKLLDSAWSRYPEALSLIRNGANGLQPSPRTTLMRVESLLHPDRPIRIKLIVYVGAFEGNAFTVGHNGLPTVAVPIEISSRQRGPIMTHEFVHAVQISMGSMSGGWVRSIGETALAEGLAMRVTQHLYPTVPIINLVEAPDEPGWLAKADKLRPRILADVRSSLSSSRSSDVFRFTMGLGPSGIDREAYYVGWEVVGYWLAHGRSYADIARIPESQAPEEVGRALDAMKRGK
jgi:hypothetical protein